MEFRIIRLASHDGCPFSGSGTVVVLETSELSVRLMYPVTLDEFSVPVRDHLNQQGVVDREGFVNSTTDDDLLWPVNKTPYKFNVDSWVAAIRRATQYRYLYSKPVPRLAVETILSELQGISVEDVRKDLDALQASTKPLDKPRGQKPKQLPMEGTSMPKKKAATGHRDNVTYLATSKLDPEKFRGQRQQVAKALGAFSTPKDLAVIAEKVKANGNYKVNADGGLTDSVHYHLRELVKAGVVKETKVEKPAKSEQPEEVLA